jgi:hypothetical protein
VHALGLGKPLEAVLVGAEAERVKAIVAGQAFMGFGGGCLVVVVQYKGGEEDY